MIRRTFKFLCPLRRPIKAAKLITGRYGILWTESPEKVDGIIKTLGIADGWVDSVYRMQNTALEKIRTQKSTKALIAGAMLPILGINLYLSFTKRKKGRIIHGMHGVSRRTATLKMKSR